MSGGSLIRSVMPVEASAHRYQSIQIRGLDFGIPIGPEVVFSERISDSLDYIHIVFLARFKPFAHE